jgi:hypothetical protein
VSFLFSLVSVTCDHIARIQSVTSAEEIGTSTLPTDLSSITAAIGWVMEALQQG